MAGKSASDAIIASASTPQTLADQADLSQRVQALALKIARPGQAISNDLAPAPAGKWDKFVDVTEQGIKHIPDGMWNAVKNPLGLIENAAISVGTGIATKILMPESGPLGALFGIGLGLYFTEQTVVPVYNAYKTGMHAKTMGEINSAGSQLGDAIGGAAINVPVGIAGYKLGARLGTEIMASPKMAGFVQWKAATLNPINNAMAAGIDTAISATRDGIASLTGKLRGASELQVAELDDVMTHKFEPRALTAANADMADMDFDKLIKVPLVRQAKGYTCGVASLASILQHYGEEYREDYLARMCHSNNTDGTLYRNIEKFAKSKGFDVDVHKNWTLDALKESIDQKKPPMLMIQAWPDKPVLDFTKDWNDGHFVVAIGYDAKNMYFMDPSTTGNYTYIPIPEFLTRWHDVDGHTRLRNFGMVISKGEPTFNYREIKPLE